MRKLALDDDILLEIEKPARYIGNEVNAVVKDLNEFLEADRIYTEGTYRKKNHF